MSRVHMATEGRDVERWRPRQTSTHVVWISSALSIALLVPSLVALVGGPLAWRARRHARLDGALADSESVQRAAQHFLVDNAEACPTPNALVDGGYLDPTRRVSDAWGVPFRIRCQGDEVVVRSAGVDALHGTKDDIEVGCPGDRRVGWRRHTRCAKPTRRQRAES